MFPFFFMTMFFFHFFYIIDTFDHFFLKSLCQKQTEKNIIRIFSGVFCFFCFYHLPPPHWVFIFAWVWWTDWNFQKLLVVCVLYALWRTLWRAFSGAFLLWRNVKCLYFLCFRNLSFFCTPNPPPLFKAWYTLRARKSVCARKSLCARASKSEDFDTCDVLCVVLSGSGLQVGECLHYTETVVPDGRN